MSIVRTRSFLPSEGGYTRGGGDEGRLKKTKGGLINLKEGITAVVIVLLLDQQSYSGREEAQPHHSQLKE